MRLQLDPPKTTSPLRDALHTAALALLLVPAAAQAQSAPTTSDHVDFTSLLYGEAGRTQVVEPTVRFTHLLPGGQSLSAQFGVDVITGASPSGALPSGVVQTHTSASGRTTTSPAGQIPTTSFSDRRFDVSADWQKPWGRFVITNLDGHYSTEKDYDSAGVSGKITTDLMQRLLTLTIGGGVSHDNVFPTGGTPIGLSDGTELHSGKNPKNVTNMILGVSRVISRRWMIGVNGTRTSERGYLTEPYKVISIMEDPTGFPIGQLTDKRPSTRDRSSLLFSSVYHLTNDVLYTSYRFYRDTWDVRSHTVEVKYRRDLSDDFYIEPLLRFYKQTAASFYTVGLRQGAPLPDYATSDYRLGPLSTVTLGATLGFRTDMTPGEWTLRAQYVRQAGDGSPPNAIGIQRSFDLAPAVNSFALVLGYSFNVHEDR